MAQKKARTRTGEQSGRPEPPDPLSDLAEAEAMLEDQPAAQRRTALSPQVPSLDDLKHRAEQWSLDKSLQACLRIACSIPADLDLRSVIKLILTAAVQTLGAERGVLLLGRGTEAGLVPVLALNIQGEELENLERVSRTILQKGQTGEIFLTPDAMKDPRLIDVPSVPLKEIRSVICAPLVAQGETVGVLYVDSLGTSGAFPQDSTRFLEAFACIAAVALQNAYIHADLRLSNARLRTHLASQDKLGELVSANPAMTALKEKAAVAARVDAPVLILGEPGTETELLARGIYHAGSRSMGPFVAYNCGAGPRLLLEGILLGHAGGSGSTAGWKQPGLFREADRGVLFLGEITALDLGLQERLLRVLEEKAVRPVAGIARYPVDVRLIASTSKDIGFQVRAGRFRKDLYYALSPIELRVPPLRERPEDIPVLIQHFLQKHGKYLGRTATVSFSPEALELLQGLAWIGNVRELEALIVRVLVQPERGEISAMQVRKLLRLQRESRRRGPEGAPGVPPAGIDIEGGIASLDDVQREAIREALIRTQGNKTKTARLLGIRRETLERRIKTLQVPLEGIPSRRGRK